MFSQRPHLNSHNKKYHSSKTYLREYLCCLCNQSYKDERYLSYHNNTVHGNKEFECSICERICNSKDNLLGHLKRIHLK